jgi:predicted  nucleic acid-binding Zn-ribbon protein
LKHIEEEKTEASDETKLSHDALKAKDHRLKSEISTLRGKKSSNELKIKRLREQNQQLQQDFSRAQEMLSLGAFGGLRHHIPPELMALMSGHFGGFRKS